jgi:TRAP-type mannitol/chloroaromatic compound transport system substrate-binding protein
MINNDKWDALSDQHKAQLEAVCGDSIRDSLAESEALQFAALKSLEEQGVTIHRWPQEILDELETAWQDVVAELSAEDADFKRVWESLSSFRANYKIWKELGYLQ